MEAAIAMLLLVAIFLILMSYARVLNSIASLSRTRGIEIFGTVYRDAYHLMADIGFLNDLWSGKKIQQTQDSELALLLSKARKLLQLQIIVGIFPILLFILFELIRAGN